MMGLHGFDRFRRARFRFDRYRYLVQDLPELPRECVRLTTKLMYFAVGRQYFDRHITRPAERYRKVGNLKLFEPLETGNESLVNSFFVCARFTIWPKRLGTRFPSWSISTPGWTRKQKRGRGRRYAIYTDGWADGCVTAYPLYRATTCATLPKVNIKIPLNAARWKVGNNPFHGNVVADLHLVDQLGWNHGSHQLEKKQKDFMTSRTHSMREGVPVFLYSAFSPGIRPSTQVLELPFPWFFSSFPKPSFGSRSPSCVCQFIFHRKPWYPGEVSLSLEVLHLPQIILNCLLCSRKMFPLLHFRKHFAARLNEREHPMG